MSNVEEATDYESDGTIGAMTYWWLNYTKADNKIEVEYYEI